MRAQVLEFMPRLDEKESAKDVLLIARQERTGVAERLPVALILVLALLLAPTLATAARPAPTPQEVFAPYWTAEAGWETELQLKNNLT